MNRTDRLYAIREELRRAGPRGRTAEQLAATFETSIRTVKRDISALQTSGFPVWARLGRTGGYVVDAQATLPPVNLTPSEVSGLAVLLSTSGGQPFTAHARSALTKVLAVATPSNRDRVERLASRVWVSRPGGEPPIDPAVRTAVEEGLAAGRVLALAYRDEKGTESRRRVDPQMLARTAGHWYLVGYCHHRRAIRWFRLDRVVTARLTQQPSVDRPISEIGEPPAGATSIAW